MNELDELKRDFHRTRDALNVRQGEARILVDAGKRVKKEIASLKAEIDVYEKAAGLLTTIFEEKQNTAQQQIEALVTQGLQTIFETDMSFHIKTSVKAKAHVSEFVIRSVYNDRILETPVMDAKGGGVSAVVGYLLRIVIMLLSLGKQESILFLDETFAFVSKEHGIRLAEFTRELVDETGISIVLVAHTHVNEFLEVADKRYEFALDKDGYTKVTEL